MRIHDAANIFPPMSEREFAELVADMGEHGQREPIVTVDGAIVDGRHRARACEALGLEPVVREWEGPGSLTAYVVSMNLHRRHMDESQRAMVAERLRRMPSANLHPDSDTAEQAADLLNVSRRSVFTAAKVLDKGAPELVAAVDAGQVAVSTAALVAGLPVEEQVEVVARGEREILAKAREIRATRNEDRRQERVQKIAAIAAGNPDLAPGEVRYPVIYADPPWRYEFSSDEADAIENHYPTMDHAAICALPVADMATPDAILFLWATSPKLTEAIAVVESWGFTYRTCAVWDKQHMGMGYYFRQQHELLLVATRGAMPVPAPTNRPASIYSEKKGVHSAKPAAFAELIERMYPELPRLELFCRSPRDGWAVWGNQAS